MEINGRYLKNTLQFPVSILIHSSCNNRLTESKRFDPVWLYTTIMILQTSKIQTWVKSYTHVLWTEYHLFKLKKKKNLKWWKVFFKKAQIF